MIPTLARNIDCAIVADSINPSGSRITTFLLKYPRFIHAEFMTHRCFSRNAASSRAIPIELMVRAVANSPAEPEFYASNKSGMAAVEEVDLDTKRHGFADIMQLRLQAMDVVAHLSKLGFHKQIANRYIEPWSHITVIATATDPGLRNFFALRAHPAAQQEFQVLAYRMLDAYMNSAPAQLDWDQWHLPFGEYMPDVREEVQIKIAVARCCWVSYKRHDKDSFDINDAIKRHDECLEFGHMSPLEHVAQASEDCPSYSNFDVGYDHVQPSYHSGWFQYRKMWPDECQKNTDLDEVMRNKPNWITL
jgi:thymidylate synthase ThyX